MLLKNIHNIKTGKSSKVEITNLQKSIKNNIAKMFNLKNATKIQILDYILFF